jgi:hypothetical protein
VRFTNQLEHRDFVNHKTNPFNPNVRRREFGHRLTCPLDEIETQIDDRAALRRVEPGREKRLRVHPGRREGIDHPAKIGAIVLLVGYSRAGKQDDKRKMQRPSYSPSYTTSYTIDGGGPLSLCSGAAYPARNAGSTGL